MKNNHLILLPVLLLVSSFALANDYQDTVNRLLPGTGLGPAKLKDGKESIQLAEGKTTIYGGFFIKRMYQENNWQPLWSSAAIASLAKAIKSLDADGLNATEYRFEEIRPILKSPSLRRQSQEAIARTDILLTESYLRAMYNLFYGKTDPERIDSDNNFVKARDGKDRSALLLSWVKNARIDQAFDWARPKNPRYKWLKNGLIKYQKIAAKGGWPVIPKGKTIRPGDTDKRIPLIRKRLEITGDMEIAGTSNVYDDELTHGVRNFQERHYLKVDGVIGPGTLGVMNVPVQKRIDQIRVNIERQRWLFPEQAKEYLVVDIAGFQIFWIKNGETIWQEQVQVGKQFTKTPIFKDKIRYLDFNPTWTVPPGIMRRTIIPNMRKDPGYISRMGYQLLTLQGKQVSPQSVNWSTASSKIPYLVRQPPSRRNALGLVKFMFPNKHSVFLHDTNHREYFGRNVRTTSSGCIRLRNPFDLAERLLKNQGWNRNRINRVIASKKTTRVNLEKPMPILIHYSTAWAIDDEVSFKKDIYNRDGKVLAQLNGPFRFHLLDLPSNKRARIRRSVRSASAAKKTAAEIAIESNAGVVVEEQEQSTRAPVSSKWKSSFLD